MFQLQFSKGVFIDKDIMYYKTSIEISFQGLNSRTALLLWFNLNDSN